jgi:M6 family metalloprotease-like protein
MSVRFRPGWMVAIALGLVVAVSLAGGQAVAVPVWGDLFTLTQPDGERVDVRIWGDEFYQRVESLDGYTVVRDPATQVICYARLSPNGRALLATGVRLSNTSRAPVAMPKSLDLPADVRAAQAAAARAEAPEWARPGQLPALDRPRAKAAGDKSIDEPLPVTSGPVKGLTILVDFYDEHASVSPAVMDAFFNEQGYTGFGNHGSVRDYFFDVSHGKLDFTNDVSTSYYRASLPKSYWEDPSISRGWRARELVLEALVYMEVRGFDFSDYDANGDGFIDAVHCVYAGTPANAWGLGLWPQTHFLGFMADGVVAADFSISYVDESPYLGTYCHESGHLLFMWPDLYDLGFESAGAGLYCLMSNPGLPFNPTRPCGPLRDLAGWTDTVLLDGVYCGLPAMADGDRVYRVQHPVITDEFYMIENRQAVGRDEILPDSGLAVWHVDWRGSNNDEQASVRDHYMVALVQADGRLDLEHDRNYGDEDDLFGAPVAVEFTPDTNPAAIWWRYDPVPLFVENISASGDSMAFDFRDGIGILPVQIVIDPPELDAPWHLTGADGYGKTGVGNRLVFVPNPIDYTITWLPVPGWVTPPPTTVTVDIPPEGPPVPAHVAYTDPPFAPIPGTPLAVPGPVTSVSVVDVDGDGDQDIFVCQNGAANRLLRNDGAWQFTDITPAELGAIAATQAAVWADVDNDGDQDVYLVREGGPDQLFFQEQDLQFVERSGLVPADNRLAWSASWVDIDNDGFLDLYRIIDQDRNQVLMAVADPNKALTGFRPIINEILAPRRSGRSAAWCDYDNDGHLDVYLSFIWNWNRLARNLGADAFENTTSGGLGGPHRGGSAVWGDVNGDGRFDLYVANDHAPDRLFTYFNGIFIMEGGPYLSTPGDKKGAVLADFDNDGDLDIYVTRDLGSDLLLLNDGEDGFKSAPLLVPNLETGIRGVACGDFDGDGGQDLIIARENAPSVILRNTLRRGHWLQFDLRGTRSNADAIGTRVRIVSGGKSQVREVSAAGSSRCQDSRRLHFGLASATRADSVIVRWPGFAAPQILLDVEADRLHLVTQIAPADTGDGGGLLPRVSRLLAPYPNPFNPAATITFDLARAGRTTLEIYAVDGKRVATLVDEPRTVGRHTQVWGGVDDDGRRVASGVYFARLTVPEGERQIQRMALVR